MMEYLEQLTGTRINAFSFQAAVGAFMFGLVQLVFMKALFARKGTQLERNNRNSSVIERGSSPSTNITQIVWTFMIISSLVIVPVIAFFFLGETLEQIFNNVSLQLQNRAFV